MLEYSYKVGPRPVTNISSYNPYKWFCTCVTGGDTVTVFIGGINVTTPFITIVGGTPCVDFVCFVRLFRVSGS